MVALLPEVFDFNHTYLNLDIPLYFALLFNAPMFFLEKGCSNSQRIWIVDR